jgi:SAM-dependent methyltransferase
MTSLELHGIYHELSFWKEFVKTDRFLSGWVKKVKTPELNQEVADFILSVPHETVLDVGSGVCSLLNGLVKVTACDPLGDLYKLIFDYERHKLTSPLPIPAEKIKFQNEFDIVHISNALDHCQSPYDALNNLLGAVKEGGYLIVQGFCNEADYENWQGFHQWNLDLTDSGILTIKNKESQFDTLLEPHLFKKIDIGNKQWFYWIEKKY